jgi:N,N'-diacetylbacillosaminyl-diphospho-undecaprenol alpha-1,3-N-acetylgalactosaminyltransferase
MIIHSIHVPVSARQFVAPLVRRLRMAGMPTILALGSRRGQEQHLCALEKDPRVLIDSDLSGGATCVIKRIRNWYRLLRRLRPTVVHAHQMRASVIPLIAAWVTGVPIRIYHNHGLPYLGHSGLMRVFLRLIERLNLVFATDVWLVSHSNRLAAQNDGLLCGRRSVVIGWGSAVGIDSKAWSSKTVGKEVRSLQRQRLAFSPAAFVVLFVGRPTCRKGFEDLLRAWTLGDFSSRGAQLVCVGFSVADIPNFLLPLPLGVTAHGMIDDLRSWYAAVDAVCLPSWHEGFPYALLEAAAASRPTIGADVPGIRCAIMRDQTGLLVPVQSPTDLCKALMSLEKSPELRQRLGENGRFMVEKHYDQVTILNQQEEWYRKRLSQVVIKPNNER